MSKNDKIKDFSKNALEQGKNYCSKVTALTTNVTTKETSSGKEYWSIDLVDKTGSLTVKKWSKEPGDAEILRRGNVISVLITGDNYGNRPGGTIKTAGEVDDDADISDYENSIMLCVPAMEKWLNNFIADLSADENAKIILDGTLLLPGELEKFCEWPGGKTCHHNVPHGLLMHTYCVIVGSVKLASFYNKICPGQINFTVLKLAALVHDYGKLLEYSLDADGNITTNDIFFNMNPHSLSTVLRIEQIDAKTPIDRDFKMALEHCILSHHGEPDHGAMLEPHTLEAVLLNAADELDAKMYSGLMAMLTLEKGEITRGGNGRSVMRI